MKKKDFENVIVTGQIEGKNERGKRNMTYRASLRKSMAEQVFKKTPQFITSYKRQKIVEIHNHKGHGIYKTYTEC